MSTSAIPQDQLENIKEPLQLESSSADVDSTAFLIQVERDKKKEELAGLVQDRVERKDYAGKIFKLICFWLCGVFLLIVGTALGGSPIKEMVLVSGCDLYRIKWGFNFSVSDSVLLAIVGGTTATVLGLFAIVANYLFPRRAKD